MSLGSCLPAGVSIKCERSRQVAVRLDLGFQVRDLLFGSGNGIGARDEAARRRLLIGNRNERARELRWISGLPAILGFPVLDQRPSAFVVVGDGRLGVVRRLFRQEFRAEEAGIDDGGIDAEGCTSACSDSIQPSRPNFDAA